MRYRRHRGRGRFRRGGRGRSRFHRGRRRGRSRLLRVGYRM
jgi:hypothetical protein